MIPRFILVNGEIIAGEDFKSLPDIFLVPHSRLDDYIWFCNGKIPLFDEHLVFIRQQTGKLNLKYPEIFNNQAELKRLLLRLINRNKAFHSGVLVCSLIYCQGEIETFFSLRVFETDEFEFKKEGLLADYSENIKYSPNNLNSVEFYNQIVWNLTRQIKIRPKYDGFIILNQNQEIVEFTGGNLFFIKENVICTPSEETGCSLPPLRVKVLEAASVIGFKIQETRALHKSNLPEMEEAFVASETHGIQKITGVGAKRFTHVKTAKITNQLNLILTEN